MSISKSAEQIADIARASISDFCINECGAYCCRKGYIMVRQHQLNQMATKERQKLLEDEGKLREFSFSGKIQIDFTNSLGGCPALKDNMCSIHKNPERPKVCHEFPIFIIGDKVKISLKCPAHQQNKFYPYIKQFIDLGFDVM